ncbi:MAG: hypothetical protein K6G33_00090 [Ruminococcus sp.]|uniref:hypothetical protein n=1 Tax=Ruminococcus sp. TaxID=41978 RepID=UPI0025D4A4F8|nr:hypothetical protein [Ruminococcus sp.]MCR5599131.1 hypothetical protein [Ruminococcus sp.]
MTIDDLIHEVYLKKQYNAIGQLIIISAIILITIFIFIIMINSFKSKKELKKIRNELQIANRQLTHNEMKQESNKETEEYKYNSTY